MEKEFHLFLQSQASVNHQTLVTSGCKSLVDPLGGPMHIFPVSCLRSSSLRWSLSCIQLAASFKPFHWVSFSQISPSKATNAGGLSLCPFLLEATGIKKAGLSRRGKIRDSSERQVMDYILARHLRGLILGKSTRTRSSRLSPAKSRQ